MKMFKSYTKIYLKFLAQNKQKINPTDTEWTNQIIVNLMNDDKKNNDIIMMMMI